MTASAAADAVASAPRQPARLPRPTST